MEYTVQRLGRMAGVTARTLRYYDEIGLLKPARVSTSGYRIYGEKEVDKLQQILFYRELDINLQCIKRIMASPSFDEVKALREHRETLLDERKRLDLLIENIDRTIAHRERSMEMSDKEKFEGFKREMIEENEKKYGREVRQKYGHEAMDKSNKKLANMTGEDFDQTKKLEKELMDTLKAAFKTGDASAELAQKAADLHRQWLTQYWDSYSKEAHAGLAQMYVDDERFTAYYDKEQPGLAEFLRDAILVYTNMK